MNKRYRLVDGAVVAAADGDCPIEVFINPDESERERIRSTFHIDDHTLSSALDPDEVSRFEQSGGNLVLIWKRPRNYSGADSFFFDVASVGLLLSPDRFVAISTDDVQMTGTWSRQAPVPRTPLDVLLGILFSTSHHYLEHLKVIKMIARDLQEKINASMENKHLIQMFNLSESLVYYINAIHANGTVLNRLRTHAEKVGYPPESIAFIDDLIVENNQCYRQAEIYSTVFSGLMDARGSLVNNNMSVLLKNLTLINVVFLPLNLIASIGGMSEYSMMTRRFDWRLSYLLFIVAMVGIGWITSILLRRVDFSDTSIRALDRRRARRR
jgi:magnesium transporter